MIRKVDNWNRIKTITLIGLILGGSNTLFAAQDDVEWLTLGNDYSNTRYTTSEEITRENFDQLEVVWEWDGASLGAASGRSVCPNSQLCWWRAFVSAARSWQSPRANEVFCV